MKAMDEDHIHSILLNPKTAIAQDLKQFMHRVYPVPITPENVERYLQLYDPDGIFLSCGGKTAFNCVVELYKSGFFQKYSCNVLG